MTSPRDLAAEALALSEDPREPMVSYLRLTLLAPIDPATLRAALALVINANEKLNKFPCWVQERISWRTSAIGVAGVWVDEAVSVEAFFSLPIPFGPGPVWRVKQESDRVVHLAVHHILADGVAIVKLIASLLQAIDDVRAGKKTTAQLTLSSRELCQQVQEESRWRLLARIAGVLLAKRYRACFSPPVLLGERVVRDGAANGHCYAMIGPSEFQRIKDRFRGRAEVLPLSDVFLVALHLAIDGHHCQTVERLGLPRGGRSRISVLLPIDRRHYQAIPEPLWNCVGTVNIHSYAKDRHDRNRLIRRIKRQTEKLQHHRRHSSSYALLQYFTWLRQRGFVKLAPPSGNPLPKPDAWRWDNTACLSYIPIPELPAAALAHLESLAGVPPVQTPMGVSVGIGGMKNHLTLTMRYSESCLAREEAQALFASFLSWIHRLAEES